MKEEIKEEIIENDLNFESDLCIESNDLGIKTETISECEYTERNGWHCYPIDDNDPKLHQKTLVVLDKLRASFDNMCFQDCNGSSKTIVKEEKIDASDYEDIELAPLHIEIDLKKEEKQYYETYKQEIEDTQGDYTCEASDKSGQNLQAHISSTHTGEKRYTCEVCRKSFRYKYSLKLHLRTHTGEKPYTCEFCRESFRYKHGLKVHLRTHTGEIPYTCEICRKSYSLLDNLKKHQKTHIVEKPNSCKICKRSLSSANTLKVHLRTHTGANPYKCGICRKVFRNRKNFYLHVTTNNTVEKPYTCEVCRKQFCLKLNLKKHLRTHTGTYHTHVKFVGNRSGR